MTMTKSAVYICLCVRVQPIWGATSRVQIYKRYGNPVNDAGKGK